MAAPQALSAEVPDALRSVRALILRGEEVERYAESSGNAAQKRVSYYCFMRAMEKAVESGKTGEPEVGGWRECCPEVSEAAGDRLSAHRSGFSNVTGARVPHEPYEEAGDDERSPGHRRIQRRGRQGELSVSSAWQVQHRPCTPPLRPSPCSGARAQQRLDSVQESRRRGPRRGCRQVRVAVLARWHVPRAALAPPALLRSTARSYNVAANFFDILSQFGPLDAEQEQMRKYAQFKTLDILNALKQGRRPTPGVPGADAGGVALGQPGQPSPAPSHDAEEDDVVLRGAGVPSAPGGMSLPAPPTGASQPPPYAPMPSPAPAPAPAPSPAPGNPYAPSAPGGVSSPPSAAVSPYAAGGAGAVPSVPATTVPASAAVAVEESACLAQGSRVHFRSDAMHDAWKLARHALRALEMDDAAAAASYLGQASSAVSMASQGK